MSPTNLKGSGVCKQCCSIICLARVLAAVFYEVVHSPIYQQNLELQIIVSSWLELEVDAMSCNNSHFLFEIPSLLLPHSTTFSNKQNFSISQ
jgi:hypothetical protein